VQRSFLDYGDALQVKDQIIGVSCGLHCFCGDYLG